jgi:hypothetical protein
VTFESSAYMRFRRALDRRNVTEALSAATEIQVVGLVEALELTLLLADRDPAKYERAALRWHARFMREVPKVEMRESQAILSLLALVPGYATSSRQRDFFFPQHRPEHTYDEEHAIGLTGERQSPLPARPPELIDAVVIDPVGLNTWVVHLPSREKDVEFSASLRL